MGDVPDEDPSGTSMDDPHSHPVLLWGVRGWEEVRVGLSRAYRAASSAHGHRRRTVWLL